MLSGVVFAVPLQDDASVMPTMVAVVRLADSGSKTERQRRDRKHAD
jgi:hypothetical protein